MQLRSGKKINCFASSQFGREADDLLKFTDLCEIALDTTPFLAGCDWYEFLKGDPYLKVGTVRKVAGGLFSPACGRVIAFDRFISKWMLFINKEFTLGFREVICEKLEEAIDNLHSMEKKGHERFCGCGDNSHVFDDEILWDYYTELGPGFLQENDEGMLDWILTPEVSNEEFEDMYHINRNSWRHDLLALRERLESHLAYFNRVPHEIHQEIFFALSCKSTPSACAKHILSFL